MMKLKGILKVLAPRAFYGQEINPKLEALGEKYKRAMAQAFGVPEEWIREDIVKRWVLGLTRAFIKPEYWEEFLRRQGLE